MELEIWRNENQGSYTFTINNQDIEIKKEDFKKIFVSFDEVLKKELPIEAHVNPILEFILEKYWENLNAKNINL